MYDIQDICRRFAKLGYLIARKCLNVLLMFVLSNIQEIRKVSSKVPDAQVMSDWRQTSLRQASSARNHKQTGESQALLGWADCLVVCSPQEKLELRGNGRLVRVYTLVSQASC